MRISALLLAAALCACSKGGGFEAPALEDAPELAAAGPADLQTLVPAYGVVQRNGEIEVNVEAADAKLVRPGQTATAYRAPARTPIPCRVARVLRAASAETGQAIAWLVPAGAARAPVNDFVEADVLIAVRRVPLAVPRSALLVKDGKTVVVLALAAGKDKPAYAPAEVRIGAETAEFVEIVSGLKAGDRVVTRGGIGYAYPDFKAAAD